MRTDSVMWPKPPESWGTLLPMWCQTGSGDGAPEALISKIFEASRYDVLCPPLGDLWQALAWTAPEDVRVILLGQDPYHARGLAHGPAFSVADPLLPLPPSLRNIFKERADDLGQPLERPSNLKDWAAQGVFLLNATLTTELGQAGKHQNDGWEEVVDGILVELMRRKPSLVWILWGRPAQAAYARAATAFGEPRPMDECIASSHPSPLAAYRGFWGSKPFSRANVALRSRGESEIVW